MQNFYDKIEKECVSQFHAIQSIQNDELEVEVRFGKYSKGGYHAGIKKEDFDKLLIVFMKSNAWSSKYTKQSTDYFDGNVRLNHSKNGYICFEKIKLGSGEYVNPDNKMYDIRLSQSIEKPHDIPENVLTELPNPDKYDHIRHKQRFTFVYSDIWLYEFTVCTVNSVHSYELEIEMINPKMAVKKYNTKYLAESLVLMIKDIMNMINT